MEFLYKIEYLTSLIIILLAILFIMIERITPYNKGQKIFRKGFFLDLVYYTLIQNYVLGIIIFSFVIVTIDNATGLSRMKILTDVPVWIQLILFTVTHDFYIYWMHRWQHKNKFLWRLHEAHHSPEEVDWLSGSRSHPVEILVNQTIEFLPIVLLGSPVEVISYKGLMSAIWGMFIHSNISVNNRLKIVINGPDMHRWHHAIGKGKTNFATKLSLWDWIFDTAYLPSDKSAEKYGIKNYPQNYFTQVVYAFRSFKK